MKATHPLAKDRNRLELAGCLDGHRAFTGPEHVVIDLTNRCNANCIACWTYSPLLGDLAPGLEWERQALSREAVIKLLKDLAELGTQRIRYTGGGEPMLHPAFLELVKVAKAQGLITAVTTNFLLTDRFPPEALIGSGLDEISISLWAASEEIYGKTHPRTPPAKFGKILDGIRKIISQRTTTPAITLCHVLSRINYHETEAMFDQAVELGVDGVYYTLVDPVKGATESLLLTDEERSDVLGRLERVRKKAGAHIRLDNIEQILRRLQAPGAGLGIYDGNIVDQIPCTVGWHFSRILANGDVAPCCRGVALPMGNIHKNSFREIWNGQLQRRFRTHAKYLRKSEPYFREVGCQKMCDNYMHNEAFNQRLEALDPSTRQEMVRFGVGV